MVQRLPKSFFERDSEEVARDLLGHRMVRTLPSGERIAGIIVETEAPTSGLAWNAH